MYNDILFHWRLCAMRFIKNPQMQIGSVDISKIEFDKKSRDEMPQLLAGLQYIYTNIKIRNEIFELLENRISPNVDKKNGRPGMDLWKIFVLGTVRLNLNWNYDRLHDEVNNHAKIREMLGHGIFDTNHYHLQTIKDNVGLLTLELLDEINQIVVKAGHILVKKKEREVLNGRTDSFVVETNVHYPTDINLLDDAMRKVIKLTAGVSNNYGLSDWRQSEYNLKQVHRAMRTAQNKKRSKSKTEAQKEKNDSLIIEAHKDYISVANMYLTKARETLAKLENNESLSVPDALLIANIKSEWMRHADRQIDQIRRRVICGETIPHKEKVFSLFEPHTEWVVKGKAGVPFELGLKVCVVEDQYRFILHHQVMEKETDDQVAVHITKETQNRFPDFKTNSYDRGFHSPANQEALSKELDFLILPRKGKLSAAAREIENTEKFIMARRQHSAVESAINALEVHGLDICLDHGIDGFKKYVSLAVVARNIQRIGAILRLTEQEKARRKKNKRIRNETFKRAA
jgi:transposase, IS5 family